MLTPAEKTWRLRAVPGQHALPAGIPQPIVQVLLSRGIDTPEKLTFLLEPPHNLPYDPLRLNGMDRALQRLYQAVEKREKVGVFGDFDVDGITGTAIVVEGLEEMGVTVVPYLPHRVDEGHGLSSDAVNQLVQQGVSLIVTVDCGVTSVAEVAEAGTVGADVIITDHHTPPETPPEAISIINPRLDGSLYPFGDLCGAGIAFKLMQGLYQYYGQPWNPALVELAALGTIADLVPLLDENRFLVRQGLVELARTNRPGLLALYRWANVKTDSLNAGTISFQIAPRLNSAGRMSHALESLQLLTTKSESEAETLAQRLEGLNQDRRDLTEQAFTAAREQVEQLSSLPPVLIVADPCITPGVAGLVAGRLVEMYNRPSVVLAETDEEHVVASGRSVQGFNLVQSFAGCNNLFVRYGGHSQAAGFTLTRKNIPALREKLTAIVGELLVSPEHIPDIEVDAELKLSELTPEFLHWFKQLEPFGVGNPQPTFLIKGLQVMETRYVGQSGQHVRLRVQQHVNQGTFQGTALAFNQASRWVEGVTPVDLVCTISVDFWNGAETITLKAIDSRASS